jgi:hypothetical protein
LEPNGNGSAKKVARDELEPHDANLSERREIKYGKALEGRERFRVRGDDAAALVFRECDVQTVVDARSKIE